MHFFWYVLFKFSQDFSSPFVVIEHVFTPDLRKQEEYSQWACHVTS